ncbi:purine utilization positive regulator [Fusarium heterosporum]|uniref:Purine utilization positive regulator n=1 Tax=Fusarium heterosporum TaxID=42747 RepID=A0A8H5WZB4_FUSHE|nr:purine utilization positive regulator [Fusarium heterosporum]
MMNCTACARQNESCNITDCVSYPYAVVKALQDRVNDLEARLRLVPTSNETVAVPELENLDVNPESHADLQKEAEEVGFLTTGGSDLHAGNLADGRSGLVGSAAGSTFARIFFKQLNLVPSWHSGVQGSGLEQPLCEVTTALPPQPIARALLSIYISRVHIWWPFLQLPRLRRVFQRLYENPRQCSDYEKFTLFAVLALASCQLNTKDAQSPAMMDLNDTAAYFQTALRFFNNFSDHPRDLFGIQAVLLLAIWMLDSSQSSHNNDLWQVSRYIMSAAIEAGLHRHNKDWGFTPEELEIRNRTWWCAYNLERQVATLTGRVLSIRDHAVHAMLPNTAPFDTLTPIESSMAPVLHKHNVEVIRHIITLRRIGGRILESIYIARGPNGTAMETTFQQICATSDQIRRDLELWDQQLEAMSLKPSREYSEMKVEYCLLQLLLHRPSPTFMVPSRQMASYCSKAASTAIGQWTKIERLAALYCDWQAMAIAQTEDEAQRSHRHFNNTATCLDLIDRGVAQMRAPSLRKYKDLFLAVRNKVYAKTSLSRMTIGTINSSITPGSISEGLIFNPNDDVMFSMGDGVEAYVSQVNEFLDGGGFNVDEALDAWYDALMGEIQNDDTPMMG